MNRYLQQLRAWYASLESRLRQMLIAAVATIAVLGVLGAVWLSQTPYSVLVSNRSYEDLLESAAALDEAKVPYQIVNNTSLEVPTNQLGKARAAVAERTALPSLGDVDDLRLGLTPQAQQWAFLRAREGDVARMINGISGIAASQINIVPREQSVYFGEERPASASVFLRLKPGESINQAQVRAIVNLVSSAVDGLGPDNITVADDRGNLLASGSDDTKKGDGTGPSELLEYRNELERRLVRSVNNALQPVIGFTEGFSVTTAVELDMTSKEIVSKQVDTAKQAVLSEQLEESNDQRATSGGVPGTDANLPERTSAGAGKNQNSQRSATTTNYMYPTVDEISRRPAGGIQRLSVAVQIDERRLQQIIAGAEGKDLETLKKDIQRAVEAAVGYDAARNDTVSVSFLPFAETQFIEGTSPSPVAAEAAQATLPYVVAMLALLLVFIYVIRPIMQLVAPPAVAKDVPKFDPNSVPTMVTAEEKAAAEEVEAASSSEDLASRLRLIVDNFERVEAKDLNRLVERESSTAAEVIRKWNQSR